MMKNEPRKEERSYEWAGKKWVSREREILHDSYFFFFAPSSSLDFYSIFIWGKKIKRRKNSVLPSVCTILSIRQFSSPFLSFFTSSRFTFPLGSISSFRLFFSSCLQFFFSLTEQLTRLYIIDIRWKGSKKMKIKFFTRFCKGKKVDDQVRIIFDKVRMTEGIKDGKSCKSRKTTKKGWGKEQQSHCQNWKGWMELTSSGSNLVWIFFSWRKKSNSMWMTCRHWKCKRVAKL